jgi:hypothetical protein
MLHEGKIIFLNQADSRSEYKEKPRALAGPRPVCLAIHYSPFTSHYLVVGMSPVDPK